MIRAGSGSCNSLNVTGFKHINESRVVIVTGGSGCGRSISVRFAKDGTAVVVSDLDEARGHDTVRQIKTSGDRAAFFRADVCNDSQIKKLVSFAGEIFGGVSVLVNNASAPHGDAGIESWTNASETDLPGAMYATC